jgi:hypothetical protein
MGPCVYEDMRCWWIFFLSVCPSPYVCECIFHRKLICGWDLVCAAETRVLVGICVCLSIRLCIYLHDFDNKAYLHYFIISGGGDALLCLCGRHVRSCVVAPPLLSACINLHYLPCNTITRVKTTLTFFWFALRVCDLCMCFISWGRLSA